MSQGNWCRGYLGTGVRRLDVGESAKKEQGARLGGCPRGPP